VQLGGLKKERRKLSLRDPQEGTSAKNYIWCTFSLAENFQWKVAIKRDFFLIFTQVQILEACPRPPKFDDPDGNVNCQVA